MVIEWHQYMAKLQSILLAYHKQPRQFDEASHRRNLDEEVIKGMIIQFDLRNVDIIIISVFSSVFI